MEYVTWRSCERLSILPPGLKADWAENAEWTRAMILSYGQIRMIEEKSEQYEFLSAMLKAMAPH